jgi:hypothetical protein
VKRFEIKYKSTWEQFMKWLEKAMPTAVTQREKLQSLFDKQAPGIIDWTIVWKGFDSWTKAEKAAPTWDEQREKIQELIHEQVLELEEPVFVLVYRHKGSPAVNPDTMNYWEAQRTKENLEGDINGVGGNEDLEKITIVNLKRILK